MDNNYLKVKDFAKLNRNSRNNQFSLNLQIRKLKVQGIQPTQLLNMKLVFPKKMKGGITY